MKRLLWFLLPALLLTLALLARPPAGGLVRGQTDAFIIDRADATNTFSMLGSSTLTTLIQGAAPRITIQYANQSEVVPLTSVPVSLRNLLQAVEERIVLQYANDSNTIPLTSPPAGFIALIHAVENRFVIQYANQKTVIPMTAPPNGLLSLLQSVENRFVLQFANAKNVVPLHYPVAMIHDDTPPVITRLTGGSSGGSPILEVTTQEYTTAELSYGASLGNYTTTLVDDQFELKHTFQLPTLLPGAKYYYRVSVTDRSGNTSLSPEGTISGLRYIFLPAILRQ